jgi:hypothetical protein
LRIKRKLNSPPLGPSILTSSRFYDALTRKSAET